MRLKPKKEVFNRDEFDCYNFLLTHFEPWKVDQKVKKFETDIDYSVALKKQVLKVDRSKYILMCKIEDLQAFGNSIIEIMVGKNEEGYKI